MEYMRESIFVASVRAFFKSFAAIFGVLIALVVGVFFLMFFSHAGITNKEAEVTILPDANGNRDILPTSDPVVLQISMEGVIGMDDLTGNAIEQLLLDSRSGFLEGDRVRAILLKMNTPGGMAIDGDSIYRSLMAYKKKFNVPVYAYVDGMCASAGLYICSAADKIYSTPVSLVGSVGSRIGPLFNFSGTMDKVGVQSLTVIAGKDKDDLNPYRPWKPDEDKNLQEINKKMYERFVNILTTARPKINKEELVNGYGAEVFMAEDAVNLGLIDSADGDYNCTLTDLVQAAGITEGTPYQVVQLNLPHSFIMELTKGHSPLLTGKVTHRLDLGQMETQAALSGKILYLYSP